MENQETKSKKGLVIAIVVVLVVALGVGGYFIFRNSFGIRGEKFTAENIDELMDRVSTELKDSDDMYYLSYSMMYYMMRDGLSSALTGDEDAMYKNIYGKTENKLISEGKDLMKENNITLDQYKENVGI